MPLDEANGCGPWWVPTVFTCGYFKHTCILHDLDYNEGVPKKLADENFLRRMAVYVLETETSNIKIMLRLQQGAALYFLAAEFGQGAYDRAQREFEWLRESGGLSSSYTVVRL